MLHKICDYIYVIDDGEIIIEGNKYDVFKNYDELKKRKIAIPRIIQFSELVKEKKQINMGYRDEINDLLKDIYRYVK